MQVRASTIVPALVAAALVPAALGAQAADLIVSANDAKYQRVAGKDTYRSIVCANTHRIDRRFYRFDLKAWVLWVVTNRLVGVASELLYVRREFVQRGYGIAG